MGRGELRIGPIFNSLISGPGWVGDASILVVSECLFFQIVVFFFFDDPHVVKGNVKKHTLFKLLCFKMLFASLTHSIVRDSNKPRIRQHQSFSSPFVSESFIAPRTGRPKLHSTGIFCCKERLGWGDGQAWQYLQFSKSGPGMGRGRLSILVVSECLFFHIVVFFDDPRIAKGKCKKHTPLNCFVSECFCTLTDAKTRSHADDVGLGFFLHCRLVYTEGDTTVLLHTK